MKQHSHGAALQDPWQIHSASEMCRSNSDAPCCLAKDSLWDDAQIPGSCCTVESCSVRRERRPERRDSPRMVVSQSPAQTKFNISFPCRERNTSFNYTAAIVQNPNSATAGILCTKPPPLPTPLTAYHAGNYWAYSPSQGNPVACFPYAREPGSHGKVQTCMTLPKQAY